MKKKTLAKKEKSLDEESQDLPNFQEIQQQNLVLQEALNLTDKNYFNRRILIALERIAKALEDSLESESDDEDSDDEELEDED